MSEPGNTSDDDDPAALARRFLDLWQEEVAGTGRDEGPGALTLRLAALHLAALAMRAGGGGLNGRAGKPAARAEAAPSPPRDGARRLAELARRLAACEERIVELAARGPGGGGGPAGGAGTGRA